MTIEEAIKRNNRYTYPAAWTLEQKDLDGIRLGNEALKVVETLRETNTPLAGFLLPGETKED